jgi:hypothetical protein
MFTHFILAASTKRHKKIRLDDVENSIEDENDITYEKTLSFASLSASPTRMMIYICGLFLMICNLQNSQ